MAKKGYEDIYEDYVLEDEEFIHEVGNLACKAIRRDFGISFSEEKDISKDDIRIPIVTFIMCYNEMKKKIQEIRRTNNSFEINFADRFVFGFDNTDSNVDDEKDGNFTPYFFNIENNSKSMEYESERNIVERCRTWVTENVAENPTIITEISQATLNDMKELNIGYNSNVIIPPVIVYVYDQMVKLIKVKRREGGEDGEKLDELEINFCNCFTIAARETEENEESAKDNWDDEIVITPDIDFKTGVKDDGTSGFSIEE